MANVKLKALSTKLLWELFHSIRCDIEKRLKDLADAWVELEERGQDLTPYMSQDTQFYRDIASGKLMPQVFWKYLGSPDLIRTISTLVPEEQLQLAQPGATIPYVDMSGKERQVRPADISARDLKRVIDEGRIRTPKEQIRLMPRSAPPEAPRRRNWNIAACLADYQCEAIEEMAEEVGLSPAEYLSKLLTDAKLIPVRQAARKGARRATHAEGMRASA